MGGKDGYSRRYVGYLTYNNKTSLLLQLSALSGQNDTNDHLDPKIHEIESIRNITNYN